MVCGSFKTILNNATYYTNVSYPCGLEKTYKNHRMQQRFLWEKIHRKNCCICQKYAGEMTANALSTAKALSHPERGKALLRESKKNIKRASAKNNIISTKSK
tara:strand:- start:1048 stop:1353 length:306 start_codon:yes stop_codon:yes gene_type:complete